MNKKLVQSIAIPIAVLTLTCGCSAGNDDHVSVSEGVKAEAYDDGTIESLVADHQRAYEAAGFYRADVSPTSVVSGQHVIKMVYGMRGFDFPANQRIVTIYSHSADCSPCVVQGFSVVGFLTADGFDLLMAQEAEAKKLLARTRSFRDY